MTKESHETCLRPNEIQKQTNESLLVMKKYFKLIFRYENVILCKMCNETLNAVDYVKQNFETRFCYTLNIKCDGCEENIRDLECEKCKEEFKTSKLLKTHIEIHGCVQNSKNTNLKFECQKCGWKFKVGSNLERHMQIHNGYHFACQICNKKFSRKDAMNNHEKRAHKKSQNYCLFKCEECQKDFETEKNWTIHVTRVHKQVCFLCKKVFKSKPDLDNHKKATKGTCGETFLN